MIKMWTYTGTIAFSAPEIFVGGEYEYYQFFYIYKI